MYTTPVFLCTGTGAGWVRASRARFIFTACKFEWRAQMSLLVAAQNIKSSRAASARIIILLIRLAAALSSALGLYCLLVSHGLAALSLSLSYTRADRR